jgi:hypothetical protein
LDDFSQWAPPKAVSSIGDLRIVQILTNFYDLRRTLMPLAIGT